MPAIINPLPYTFTNGTIADATQVDANNAQILANVNANAAENGANSSITSLTGLTTPLAVAEGGTGTNAFGTTLANSLTSNVSLNNATFTDGPSVAQGTSGKWFASGTVTLQDNSGGCFFSVKLWDGATVIASGFAFQASANPITVALSGLLTSPAGNLRISVINSINSGIIAANASGVGNSDSTITAIRIG